MSENNGSKEAMKMLGTNVMVAVQVESMTGGLHLPDTVKDKKWVKYFAVMCGPDCKMVKPGDQLFIPPVSQYQMLVANPFDEREPKGFYVVNEGMIYGVQPCK